MEKINADANSTTSTNTSDPTVADEDTIANKLLEILESNLETLIECYYSIGENKFAFSVNVYKLNKNILKNEYLITVDFKLSKKLDIFESVFKQLGIIAFTLVFYSQDEVNIKFSQGQIKEALVQLIHSITMLFIRNPNKKLLGFIKKTNTVTDNLLQITKKIVKIIYGVKPEYNRLRTQTQQLIDNFQKINMEETFSIINNVILYCNDKTAEQQIDLSHKPSDPNANNTNNSNTEANNLENLSIPNYPFIKEPTDKKFSLILDLDETLSHSITLPKGSYFLLRPYVVEFLSCLSELYEIIIFTSSPKNYADKILNKIDLNNKFISHRLYRKNTVITNGIYVKDLRMVGRDLTKMVIVDNKKQNAKFQMKNLVHIKTWEGDLFDKELLFLKDKFVEVVNKYEDITKAVPFLNTKNPNLNANVSNNPKIIKSNFSEISLSYNVLNSEIIPQLNTKNISNTTNNPMIMPKNGIKSSNNKPLSALNIKTSNNINNKATTAKNNKPLLTTNNKVNAINTRILNTSKNTHNRINSNTLKSNKSKI